jgi:hypothetical protein
MQMFARERIRVGHIILRRCPGGKIHGLPTGDHPPRKDSVLVFDNGQPLRKLSELLFEKKLLIPALRQLVSSRPSQHDG